MSKAPLFLLHFVTAPGRLACNRTGVMSPLDMGTHHQREWDASGRKCEACSKALAK